MGSLWRNIPLSAWGCIWPDLMGLAKISDWLSGDHERDIPSDWDFELDEARRRQQQDLCDLQEQLEDRRDPEQPRLPDGGMNFCGRRGTSWIH